MKVGDFIVDNDPRMKGRRLEVVGTGVEHVLARDSGGRKFMILQRRIFSDGKTRTSGFRLEVVQ